MSTEQIQYGPVLGPTFHVRGADGDRCTPLETYGRGPEKARLPPVYREAEDLAPEEYDRLLTRVRQFERQGMTRAQAFEAALAGPSAPESYAATRAEVYTRADAELSQEQYDRLLTRVKQYERQGLSRAGGVAEGPGPVTKVKPARPAKGPAARPGAQSRPARVWPSWGVGGDSTAPRRRPA